MSAIAVSEAIKEEVIKGNKDLESIFTSVRQRITNKEVKNMKSDEKMKKIIQYVLDHQK